MVISETRKRVMRQLNRRYIYGRYVRMVESESKKNKNGTVG